MQHTRNLTFPGLPPAFSACVCCSSSARVGGRRGNKGEKMTKNKTDQARHTPGPWKVDGWKIGRRDQVNVSGGLDTSERYDIMTGKKSPPEPFLIARIGERNPQVEANARLIASAPDLLEVVKEIVKRLDSENGRQVILYSDSLHPSNDDKTILDYLKAAIAKAEGK